MTLSVSPTRVVYTAALQRFGYYGVRSNLILYLTVQLGMSDQLAGQVYGVFYGSLFLTSIIGGVLGDTFLGYRLVGASGLILIVASHLCFAFGSTYGAIAALVLYSVGFGLFDPNMNATVAEQYRADKGLRDAAYTLLYIGINVGAMLGPIVCGYVALRTHWSYGFLTGGLFTLIGLPLFWTVNRQDPSGAGSDAGARGDSVSEEPVKGADTAAPAIRQLIIIGILGLVAVTFWAVFDQLGSSVTLLVQRRVNRHVGGFEVPAGYVQSVNPFMVVVLGPLLSRMLKRRAPSASDLGDTKFLSSGLLILGVGFGLLALGSAGGGTSGAQSPVGWVWVLSAILMSTLGELLFAPALTSLIAGLSPKKRRALIMGAWSATFGIGAYLSGTMSGLMSRFNYLPRFFAISAGACWLTATAFIVVLRVMRDRNRDEQ